MTLSVREDLLDDPEAIAAADPGGMLPAVASSAAQLREGALAATEAGFARIADEPRPRALVITGMGGSGIAGDVVAAIAGPGSPIPIITHRGHGLPGWVGPADVVAAVSASGRTEETVSAVEEALRRGCRLLAVGAAESPLAELAQAGHAQYAEVPQGRPPRASLWALATPLLVAADALGVLHAPPAVIERAVDDVLAVSERCAPTHDSYDNPAKDLALQLVGTLPLAWGTGPLGAVAAYRFSCQLAENAKLASSWGALPEAGHNQIVAFDGPLAMEHNSEDFFRDRVDDEVGPARLRLVLLIEGEEPPPISARVEAVRDIAAMRGVRVSDLVASGASRISRLATLVALGDYTSVYLGLLTGVDPSEIAPIDELKARLTR